MMSPEMRALVEQVDELCEQRIERNAEIKRLREALQAIRDEHVDLPKLAEFIDRTLGAGPDA